MSTHKEWLTRHSSPFYKSVLPSPEHATRHDTAEVVEGTKGLPDTSPHSTGVSSQHPNVRPDMVILQKLWRNKRFTGHFITFYRSVLPALQRATRHDDTAEVVEGTKGLPDTSSHSTGVSSQHSNMPPDMILQKKVWGNH